ncbi:hypothetical protein PMIN06_012898 [Paraphaeosphaeria minitans]
MPAFFPSLFNVNARQEMLLKGSLRAYETFWIVKGLLYTLPSTSQAIGIWTVPKPATDTLFSLLRQSDGLLCHDTYSFSAYLLLESFRHHFRSTIAPLRSPLPHQ